MKKNTAGQHVAFQMNATADGLPITSGTPTVYYTIDGGTQATGGGTSAHEGNGQWSYAPTQAETNGDHVSFTMALSSAISQTVNTWPSSHTDQTGDSYARIGANGAGLTDLATQAALTTVDTVVDAIKAITDNLPDSGALTTINTATARLTAVRAAILTDWINGGRLDLLLDAIPTTAMRGTDGANTTTPDNAGITSNGAAIAALNDIATSDVLAQCLAALNTAISSPTTDSPLDVLNNLKDAAKSLVSGEAEAGTLSTTQMSTDLSETTADHYNGRIVIWITGVLTGQATDITAYGATGILTYTATTEAPSAADKFVIV